MVVGLVPEDTHLAAGAGVIGGEDETGTERVGVGAGNGGHGRRRPSGD